MSNEIASPLANIIRKAMEAKSSGIVSQQREQIQKRMKNASEEIVIVADSSGSMEETIGGLNVTKFRHLEIALADIRKTHPKARVLIFSSTFQEWKGGKLPMLGGGTDLAGALEYVAKWRPKRTIIISDGLPDNEMAAYNAAMALTGVIDTIYCGPDAHPAIQFLRSLSEKTCGTSIEWDGMKTELASNIRGLLSA